MKKKITVEKVILFLAAGFAAYNFSLAGGYIEGTHWSIGGLVAGLIVNVSLAIAASRYSSIKGEKRTHQARIAFLAMMAISPVLVSPVVFYSLPETFLGVWWLRALWAIAWPLVADLAIVLAGAVSGRGLVALSEQSARSARKVQSSATRSAKSASDSVALRRTYPRKCEHCTEIIRTSHAVGAHMKKHHPELCKPKPLAVELFEGRKVQS
jgi:hypothetical protein